MTDSLRALVTALLLGALALVATRAEAQTDSEATELAPLRVLGGALEDVSRPTAPQSVGREKIEAFRYTDVNRALRQTTGVYIREEEGEGLRPNIGLRGTSPDRSKKVVLLEDGILIGPAPYSAPAAYYVPSMNHVENLEVYKGFTAVPFGPNSIGGAVNYITRDLPAGARTGVDLNYGAFNTSNLRASTGGTTGWGGYLVEASRLGSDGFKELDGGGDVGFHRNVVTGRFRRHLGGADRHLELRAGYSDETSRETYLGLTESDFDRKPFRRYAASARDDMTWQHVKLQLEHLHAFSERTALKTTVYRHDFHRVWYRLDRFQDNSVNLRNILNDPSGANQAFYDVLRGAADSSSIGAGGELITARNDRTFFSHGVQSQWSTGGQWLGLNHELEVGARLHQDQIARDHTFDGYEMTSGRLVRSATPRQVDRRNRDTALAQTLSLNDQMSTGNWVFSLLARYESVRFEFDDRSGGSDFQRTDSVFVPGLGALYKFTPGLSARVSVNQGVTVAGLEASGREAREESTNYELGLKYASQSRYRQAEMVLFYNDYRNLTGTCTTSSGCSNAQLDEQFNGGEALIRGLEARLAQGFNWGPVWLPVQLNLTWIQAAFQSRFNSTNPEWGVGLVRPGDPLPYVPEFQYTLSLGSEYRRWRQELAITYQSRMYDQSSRAGRVEIEPFGIVDWTGRYQFNKEGSVFAKVDNLLDREYAVAARPFGLRPGKPQAVSVGVAYVF